MSREEKWRAGGPWGRVGSGESSALKETRERIEAGFYDGRRRTGARSMVLALARSREMATILGDRESAEALDARMAGLHAREERRRRGDPEPIMFAGERALVRRFVHDGTRVVEIARR